MHTVSPRNSGIFGRNLPIISNGIVQSDSMSPNNILGNSYCRPIGRNSSLLFGFKSNEGNTILLKQASRGPSLIKDIKEDQID